MSRIFRARPRASAFPSARCSCCQAFDRCCSSRSPSWPRSILYTYIAPFLVPAGLAHRIDIVLLIFGAAALAGICITGMLIDRWLRELVLHRHRTLRPLASLALGLWGMFPAAVYGAVGAWGMAYGGAATLSLPDRFRQNHWRSGRCRAIDDRHGLEHRDCRRRARRGCPPRYAWGRLPSRATLRRPAHPDAARRVAGERSRLSAGEQADFPSMRFSSVRAICMKT